MKFPLCLSLLALGSFASAAELQTLTVNADAWAEGEVPKEVFIVEGKIQITAKDGNKAIAIDPGSELTDACAQVGSSAAGESSVEARVFASKRARSVPKFGVSVHGMSGHRLLVNAAKKQLEIFKSDAVIATVPFTWTPDAWIKLKLEVKRGEGDAWLVTGKAWAADAAEPAEAMIKADAKGLKGQGKVGLWGTPYSQTPIYFDDITVKIETAPAT